MIVDVLQPKAQGAVQVAGLGPTNQGQLVYADGVNFDPGRGKGWYWWNGSSFVALTTQQVFRSAEQTITQAGLLTLTHGLTNADGTAITDPALIQVSTSLICKAGEYNFTAGKIMEVHPAFAETNVIARGFALEKNATQILIRYGNNATPFDYFDWSSGNVVGLTNANWRLIVVARY